MSGNIEQLSHNNSSLPNEISNLKNLTELNPSEQFDLMLVDRILKLEKRVIELEDKFRARELEREE